MMEASKDWLLQLQSTYPICLLFWMEELLWVYDVIQKESTQDILEETSMENLAKITSNIVPSYHVDIENALRLKCYSRALHLLSKLVCQNWIERTAFFVETFHNELGSPRYYKNAKFEMKIVLHSLECSYEYKKEVSLYILAKKFKVIFLIKSFYLLQLYFYDFVALTRFFFVQQNRLPETIELLDGVCQCSEDRLTFFLYRVEAFPASSFVILNVQDFPAKHLEIITNFISKQDRKKSNISLQFIQLESTILNASPWIEIEIWDNDAYNDLVLSKDRDTGSLSHLKSIVLDQLHINTITVISSINCGTGKTYVIQKELIKLKEKHKAVCATVTVHEQSTLASLIKSLSTQFYNDSEKKRAIHFHINLPFDENNKKLINMLNYVFYSLLMTRSVYDSSSKQSFHLGKRRWDFFVELQVFLSPTNDLQRETRKKLSQFIPILAHCSSIRESLPLFEIDEETRRVCTYLRAYVAVDSSQYFMEYGKFGRLSFTC